MTHSPDKPKLRWWQFSLRKFVLLVTLFSVLVGGGLRYREWGRQLCAERDQRWRVFVTVEIWEVSHKERREFERKYWLPMKVYELTSRNERVDIVRREW